MAALIGFLVLGCALYVGSRAAAELTPGVKESRRRGHRLPWTAVRPHHFQSTRGWRYWQWARALLLVWAVYVLVWAVLRFP